jgi:hypothetical protein
MINLLKKDNIRMILFMIIIIFYNILILLYNIKIEFFLLYNK